MVAAGAEVFDIFLGAQTGYDKTQCMHGGWEQHH